MANKFFNNSYLILLLIVGLIFISIPFQKKIDKERSKFTTIEETIRLSPKFLRIMALGFDEIVADIYWLRALQYFGNPDIKKSDKDPDIMYKYFDIITELDPKFVNAYRFGGSFLAEPEPFGFNRFQKGSLIFDKGRGNNPENFRLPLEQGFLYFMHSDDKKTASELFIEASEKPGLTEHRKASFKGMAASALSKGGDRELARQIWLDIFDNSLDQGRRDFALMNLNEMIDQDLEDKLTQYALLYENEYGSFPTSIDDLLRLKQVKKIPEDHKGNKFVIDPEMKRILSPALNQSLVSSK